MVAKKKKKEEKEELDDSPLIIKDNQGTVVAQYDRKMIETIKNTVAKNATDEELDMFLSLASNYDLDPFSKEIWFIKYKGKDPQIFTSRDGFVKIAKRDADFKQINSFAVYEEDVFELEQRMGEKGLEISNLFNNFIAKYIVKIIGVYCVLEYFIKNPFFTFCDYK